MALEADYDVDLFVESTRNGETPVSDRAISRSQTIFEPSKVNTETVAVSKSRREIRKL